MEMLTFVEDTKHALIKKGCGNSEMFCCVEGENHLQNSSKWFILFGKRNYENNKDNCFQTNAPEIDKNLHFVEMVSINLFKNLQDIAAVDAIVSCIIKMNPNLIGAHYKQPETEVTQVQQDKIGHLYSKIVTGGDKARVFHATQRKCTTCASKMVWSLQIYVGVSS